MSKSDQEKIKQAVDLLIGPVLRTRVFGTSVLKRQFRIKGHKNCLNHQVLG